MKIIDIKTTNNSPIYTVDISRDGQKIVIGQDWNKINKTNFSVWSMEKFFLMHEHKTKDFEMITSARFAPNNNFLALIDSTNQVSFLNLDDQLLSNFENSNANIHYLSYSNETGRLIIVGKTIQVWNLSMPNTLLWEFPDKSFTDNLSTAFYVADLNDDGTQVAMLSNPSSSISIIDIKNNELIKKLDFASPQAHWIAFSPKSHYIAAIGKPDERLYIWNLINGNRILNNVFNEDAEGFWCLRFHPSSKYLGLGMLSGHLILVRLGDGKFLVDQHLHDGRIWDLAFTPDGNKMISVGDDAIVKVIDLESVIV